MLPLRRLCLGILVSNVGNGAWFTSWAIFLTRELPPAQVGLGMAVAAGLGLLAATPCGHLADRLGPRETLVAMLLVQAAGMALYVPASGFAVFLAAACLTTAVAQGSGGVRGALVAGLAVPERRLRALAQLRVHNHIGAALGALLGGVLVGIGTTGAFHALIGVDIATFLAYAALVASVPRVPPLPGGRLIVLRDRPYVTLAAMAGVLSLCWGMLSSGVPLWIVRHTHAAPSLGAVIVVVNSLAIAAFQVRVTRGIETPLAAARGALASGVLLAAACVLFALTAGLGGLPATALFLLAGLVHVAGELLFVAASWGLSIPLMPPGAPGQYQGMFATGEAAAQMAAPVLMTTLVAGWGQPGWLVLGALFLLATAPAVPATRWALRTRAAYAA
jgi:Major Facilitator Superfamily